MSEPNKSTELIKTEGIDNEGLPLVSVVLITYNGARYLEEQLQSIFNQSYTNIELVCMDDGSTDETVKILNAHASRRDKMVVYVNEVNLGFIKNFEKGCTLSTGSFIALCDQDDYWHPEKIEKLVSAIGAYPMIYSDSLVCNQNLEPTGTKISDIVNFKTWDNCLQLAVFCRIYAHATVFKRSFFEKAYPFLDIIPPDWWLPYLSTFHGGLKYFDEPLVYYRQHETNVYGVVGGKRKKGKQVKKPVSKLSEKDKIRKRVSIFLSVCPDELRKEKQVLEQLNKSYSSFSFTNNLWRVSLFLKYRNTFLAVKKHSAIHKILFSLKDVRQD